MATHTSAKNKVRPKNPRSVAILIYTKGETTNVDILGRMKVEFGLQEMGKNQERTNS